MRSITLLCSNFRPNNNHYLYSSAEIKELASDSLELLDALLRTKAPELVEAFPAVLDLRIYGSIIGMYELNNLTIYVPSPVLGWVNALDEAGDDAWDGVGAQSSKGNILSEIVDLSFISLLLSTCLTKCSGTHCWLAA